MAFKPRLILGIDQTGAARKQGLAAKPLSLVALKSAGAHRWKLIRSPRSGSPLDSLTSLSREAVEDFVFAQKVPMSDVLIVVDAVLGLPMEVPHVPANLWDLFGRAAKVQKFGKLPAQKFFKNFVRSFGPDQTPSRLCERMAGANSVFATMPAQKNIQTGSFRIWKDLGSSKEPWVKIWPFDGFGETQGPWMMEGYPSLIWKQILRQSRREPARLFHLLTRDLSPKDLSLIRHTGLTGDHADALVLAIGATRLLRDKKLFLPFPWLSSLPQLQLEGWIMGLSL